MKKWIFLMLTFGLILFIGMPASAFTTYTSRYADMDATRQSWLNDLGISSPDETINFESGFTDLQNILGTTLSGGLTITSSTGGYAFVTDSSSDLGGSYPLGTFALAVDEGDSYAFDFSSSISYFGFYMMDNGSTNLTTNYTDGSSENTTINGSGSSGYNGTFLALTFDKPVSSLYIPSVNGGDGEVGIDNIEFGSTVPTAPIPEPATIFLFGTGIATLVGSRIRRKKK